jgi:hypothetical protein
MKFITQFSPWSIFITILKNHQSLFLSESEREASHPYGTPGKIAVFYILILRFFDIRWEDKGHGQNDSKCSPNFSYSWFHHESFWFVSVIAKYLNFSAFSNDSLAILVLGSVLSLDDETWSYTLSFLHLFLD